MMIALEIFRNTILLCGFPGTGKTYFFHNSNKKILDSDSSKFDKKQFPQNYIEYIKNNIGKVDIICISSHQEVRKELVNNNLYFTLVYPNIDLKKEYLQRFRLRGNKESFIQLINVQWKEWIIQLKKQNYCTHRVLESNQYISDVFK